MYEHPNDPKQAHEAAAKRIVWATYIGVAVIALATLINPRMILLAFPFVGFLVAISVQHGKEGPDR